ncbi:putative Ig domain-containing protein [Actinoplanes sp. NPDC051346]|uniref:putative Ig domain-containing protein n=1 Tax=Actinoplanes sp. NPDC051346 TaxID=3155048 RepID=UPI003416583B
MTATGGKAPYWWAATGLPTGLSIKSSTGVISGTPTAAATGPVLVTATDAANIATTITIPFTVATPVTVTDPGTRADATGTPTSLTLAANGGVAPYTWAATGLPAGLSLNTTTGVITGTPTTVAANTVTVTATDTGARTHTTTFTWTITPPIVVTNPYGQVGPTGVAYSKTLTANGGTTPYRWAATGLPAGLTLDPATGVIAGTPTTAGNHTVKVTVTDKHGLTGNLTFSFATGVIVTFPGSRGSGTGMPIAPMTIKAAGGTGTYTWTATNLPPGLTVDPATGVITGTPTTNGVYSAIVTATDTTGTSGATGFTWTIAAAPELTNPGPVHVTTNVAVSQQLTATGGKAPYTWTATGLPAGLSIKSSTGLITGTVTSATTTSVTVTVTDALKITNTVNFPLTVAIPVQVNAPDTQTDPVGNTASVAITATGGTAPYAWTASGLPAGLSIDPATGTVTGTPTTVATSTVTVTATDSGRRTHAATFTWKIVEALSVQTPDTVDATAGIDIEVTAKASGGAAPYTWTATGLPAGVTVIKTTGTITGVPTTAGDFTATLTVTDADGHTSPKTVGWHVAQALAVIDPGAQSGTTGEAVTLTVVAGGGTSPYTWMATGLPAGLAINPTSGVINGIPTSVTATTVTVTVTDANSRTSTVHVSWNVAEPLIATDPGAQHTTVGAAVSLDLSARGGYAPYTWTVTGLPDGLAVDVATGEITGTPTTAGTTTTTATVSGRMGYTAEVSFAWIILAGTAAVVVDDPGTKYAQTKYYVYEPFVARGGSAPYTWTATGLPLGLAIDTATGEITGRAPETPQVAQVSVEATDAAGLTNDISFTWHIVPQFSIHNPGAQSTVQDTPVSIELTANGGKGDYTWSSVGLPPGLTLDATTGRITGRPTTVGTAWVVATVADPGAADPEAAWFTWDVTSNSGAEPITVSPLYGWTSYRLVTDLPQLSAEGGTAPYTWTATGLPDGLAIDASTGVITGAPTTLGTNTTTVIATDAEGRNGSHTFGWSVEERGLPFAPRISSYTHPLKEQSYLETTFTARWWEEWLVDGYSLVVDQSATTVPDDTVDTTTPSYTTVKTDGTWYLHVRAHTATGWGEASHYQFTIDTTLLKGPPTDVTATAVDSQTIDLSWSEVPNAADYGVYRNGELVAKTGGSTTFTDRQLDNATTYSYQVFAIDAAGTESDLGDTVTATTVAAPTNTVNYARCTGIGAVCGYTASVPADQAHPDAGGISLTDGVHGTLLYGPAWQGRNGVGDYSFTVDLGVSRSITEISTTWMQIKNDGLFLPANVSYEISENGQDYTTVASIDRPHVSDSNRINTYRAIALDHAARYVRAKIAGGSAWTMTDEFEVRGIPETGRPVMTAVNVQNEIGQPANASVALSGGTGPYTWTATGLPDGVTIDATTGVITGISTTPTRSTVTVSVTDGFGRSATAAFTWMTYRSAPTTPVMDAGRFSSTALSDNTLKTRDIVVIGNGAFTLAEEQDRWRYTIMRIDRTSGAVTRITNIVWGHTARLIGTDGTDLYVVDDYNLHRVDPRTGTATKVITDYSALPDRYYSTGTILGHFAFLNTKLGFARVNLTNGEVTKIAPIQAEINFAVDADAKWSIRGYTLYRTDLATGTESTVATELPMYTSPTNILSVGDYLYITTNNSLTGDASHLMRIRKSDGDLRLIASGPLGGNGTNWLYNATGITTDGDALVIVDRSEHGAWLRNVTAATPHTFAAPASTPDITTGEVTTIVSAPSDFAPNGAAIIGNNAFIADRQTIKKVDLNTGTVTLLAGEAERGCVDGPSGSIAGFFVDDRWDHNRSPMVIKVIGTDGTYVYVSDACGIRRVDPNTGATATMPGGGGGWESSTIAGNFLYTTDYYAGLVKVDLTSGKSRIISSARLGGGIAADDQAVWNVKSGALYRVDVNTGVETSVGPVKIRNSPVAMLSVGDYLYATTYSYLTGGSTVVVRISKATGAVTEVAGHTFQHKPGDPEWGHIIGEKVGQSDGEGRSARFENITGITTDGNDLYITEAASYLYQSASYDWSHVGSVRRVRGAIPTAGTDPGQAADWWKKLNPVQRDNAINDHPARIGWLDGVPTIDRDRANWVTLVREEARLRPLFQQLADRLSDMRDMREQGRIAELYPEAANPVLEYEVEFKDKDERWQDTNQKLGGIHDIRAAFGVGGSEATPPADRPCVGVESESSCYLVGFSTQLSGRVIVSVGNPDVADNVVTYVPGTFAGLNEDQDEAILRAGRMTADAANKSLKTTAALLWQGYDAPQSLPKASLPGYAQDAAPLLRRFLDGLRVTHTSGRASVTLMGHSYGTVVVGRAAAATALSEVLPESVNADRIIVVASPGTTVDGADDLRLTGYHSSRGRVWATTASNDTIRVVSGLVHGRDPTHLDYKARVFASAPGGENAHSEYWNPRNPSRDSFALISVGLADCPSAGPGGGIVSPDLGDTWDPDGANCQVKFD